MPVGELLQISFIEGVATSAATPTPASSLAGNTLADGKILVGNAGGVAAEVTPSGDALLSNTGVITISNLAHTKLANITAASILMGNASNIPTATAISGDISLSNSGVAAIASGVIVDADVNASAAIAGSKLQAASSSNAGTINYYNATTFTPTVFANGVNFSSVTYSVQLGTFTRIGRVVTFCLRVTWTNATGSPTGALGVGNLPHAATADTILTCMIDNVDMPASCIGMTATMAGGSTNILIAASRDAGSFVNADSSVNSGANTRSIYLSGSYQV
jgi:hypothetical protein